MDAFAIVVLGGLLALLVWVWLLGTHAPGNGHEQLGLRAPRQIVEDREALEAEDLAQMLEAHNASRRRRGEREVTVGDLELQIVQDLNEQERRREALVADRELDQLLEATNARRKARGLPERTREDCKREFGSGPSV